MSNKTTFTTAELEEARATKIAENETAMEEARGRILVEIDTLIEYLQANREHLAGFAFTAVPYDSSACVNVKEGHAADGITQFHAVSDLYGNTLASYLQRTLNRRSNPMSGLMGLFGGGE